MSHPWLSYVERSGHICSVVRDYLRLTVYDKVRNVGIFSPVLTTFLFLVSLSWLNVFVVSVRYGGSINALGINQIESL
jgi:1-acyl-sn-glycerol-3-phosphate acyltransferase